ncbi:ATP-grasp domain-containing protein [Virgibacillus sp. NKC19-16]|uniref:carboxylate--amine ligase n=1 Tax=Virgibacillus salidurans TaxID=2831673 RepID=UPI001F288080|nr:ATP-grasp domain-containing protein [Virgibacillus sp. NKC19-16]UJL45816.1 ATP-grasp domain-containing protein [Virgibacillus sp. NKC19-16]
MNYNEINVLLTEGYSRQTLPMAKAFRELGCQVTTLNASSFDVGYTSKYPTNKIIGCCTEEDYIGTVNTIRQILKDDNFDIVVPMSDFTASLLAENKEEFSQYVEVATNDSKVFNKAFDKLNTMEICMNNDIPCPQTFIDVKSIEDLKGIKYPVVIKPRSSWGSVGFNVVNNEDKLKDILSTVDKNLGPLFIQEYIPHTGKQFNAHMFLNSNHEVKSAVITEKCRWFPIDGGASTLSVTIESPEIVNICSRLLKEMKWVGYCDIDLMLDPRDQIPKVIEVNGRISANVKICYMAEVNIAKQILENAFSYHVTSYESYKEDLRLRYLHTDILWFLSSTKRLQSKPSWFSLKNTTDQIFSLDDPLPWFTFTFQALKKYKKEMRKRKRK